MNYDWQAGAALFASVVVLTMLGRWLAFRIPAVQRMREWNRQEDEQRLTKPKYHPILKQNRIIGMVLYGAFFLFVAPFFANLQPVPLWKAVVDIVAVLMVYDFFYYLMHRFLFHGPVMLKIHALHHQARDPSHIDSAYVHPVETVMGTALFLGTVLGMVVVWVIVVEIQSLTLVYVIGLVFCVAALTAKFSPHYWIYMALITPTIVCFSAFSSAQVANLGEQRLEDTIVGAVRVLIAMGLAVGYARLAGRFDRHVVASSVPI
jgi:sterol desaturase/sphingolipid hydroxylase (fatty acid hydroxylase superfamily)